MTPPLSGPKNAQQRYKEALANRVRAQLVLGNDERFTWLCDRSQIVKGQPKSWRPTLLSELGQLHLEQGPETMINVAVELCTRQLATRDALFMIRQARQAPGPCLSLELASSIIETVERFAQEHPLLEPQLIDQALEDARACLLPEERGEPGA